MQSEAAVYSSKIATDRKKRICTLEKEIQQIEILQKNKYDTARASTLKSLKAKYKDATSARAEFILLRTRQLYYEQSDRPNRLLALRLKQSERLASVDAVKDSSGIVFTQPLLVNKVFREFYSELYKSETPEDLTDMHAFLGPLDLPSLSEEQADELDAPLTLEELRSAAISMTRHKSPGLDGIPPELFLEIWAFVSYLYPTFTRHWLFS